MRSTQKAHIIVTKEPGWVWLTARLALGYLADLHWRRRTARDRRLTLGNTLVASLRAAMHARGIELWLQSSPRTLCSQDGKVTGLVVEHQGEQRCACAGVAP